MKFWNIALQIICVYIVFVVLEKMLKQQTVF
nr:DUF4029 domain-containing protein [Bacillus clarus]